jgi:katanin p60 ATPase-containing subunit A1
MVDMSGIISGRLESTLAQARRRVEQGDLDKAAAAYAQAAKLMHQYAESAASPRIKEKRMAEGTKLAAYAQQLKQGRMPGATLDQAPTGSDTDTDTALEEDSYITNAKSLITQAKVGWDDIAGLQDIKQFVKEAYALSLAQLPEGVGLPRAANLLLYGPPGTGKTLIAAAVSKGLEATFFSCKVSDMLSKYFGESTKLVNAVFQVAEEMAPAVIFLDDFESIVPSRDGDSSGPERRVLTELLTCMDGFASKSSDKLVLVVAATNKPWLIDSAILSRFGKLAYIDLPDLKARKRIFEILLTQKGYQIADDLGGFAAQTAGYSGREIEQISKELIRMMISRANPDLAGLAEQGKEAVAKYVLKMGHVKLSDLEQVMSRIVPVTKQEELGLYERWGA